MAATLAAGGQNPVSGKRVMDAEKVPGVLAVMATAGLYDDSGKWLYHTGLPAKSGVGDPTKPGMSFDLKQTTDALGEVDINALIDAAGQGADMEPQMEAISQLALIYNELLPGVPLWERYGNNPAPSRFAAGWLPDDDPIYQNNPYGDSFVVIQILDGTLHPAGE